MKRYIIYIACILTIAMWSCNSKSSKDKHEGHDHAEHSHGADGHDHSHDDHDHSHGDEEIKKNDDDHDHSGHAHAEGEEIIITPEQAKTIGLESQLVKYSPFYQIIKTSGQIVAAQGDERTVVATVSGVVSFNKASADEGKPVRQGESLFSISSKHLADGDPVVKAKSAYDIAKREFDRAEALVVDKLISQKDYNEVKLKYESAKIAYNAISGGGARGANVSSPITGFVKSRLVNEGQYVNVGDPLMIVTQNNKLQLRADVSQRYYKDLQLIKSANFKTPYDDTIYKLSDMGGQLISYGKSANDTEFYIPVNFQFNNVGNIIPGSFVEIYLIAGERENVLTIPTSSLTDEQGICFVYCKLNEEEYVKREIKIGATDGDRVEVLSGISEKDEVVTKGAYHVKLASASEAIPHSHEH